MTGGRRFLVWVGTAAIGAAMVVAGMILLSAGLDDTGATRKVTGAGVGLLGLMLAVLGLVQSRRAYDMAAPELEPAD